MDVCPGRSGTGRLTSTEQEKTSSIESVRMAMLLNQVQSGFRHAWQLPMAHAQPLQARGPAGAGGPVQPPSSPWSLQERAVAAELGSRRAGGGLLIGVQSRRRSDVAAHGLVRGVRPDAELGSADLWAALPDFPPPSAREPLRLSEVHNREPGAYTAQEKREGLHLGPEARSKRYALMSKLSGST